MSNTTNKLAIKMRELLNYDTRMLNNNIIALYLHNNIYNAIVHN